MKSPAVYINTSVPMDPVTVGYCIIHGPVSIRASAIGKPCPRCVADSRGVSGRLMRHGSRVDPDANYRELTRLTKEARR